MLSEFGLANFKPFAEAQRARLSNITLIYGPNSGGKSSIIQALMLLRQTFDAKLPDSTRLNPRGELVDLGSFKSLVYKHDVKLPVAFHVGFDAARSRHSRSLPAGMVVARDLSRRVTLTYHAASSVGSRKKDTSQLALLRYELAPTAGPPLLDVNMIRGERAGSDVESLGLKSYLLSDASVPSLLAYLTEMERRRSMRRPAESEDVSAGGDVESMAAVLRSCVVVADTGLPCRLWSEDHRQIGSTAFRGGRYRVLEGIADEFSTIFRSVSYLGPLRMSPARHYIVYDTGAETVGKRGENAPQLLHRGGRTMEQRINRWFSRFEIPYELKISESGDEITGGIIALALKDTRTKVSVGPADVGFGIGQLLPVLVEGLVSAGRIICVEQPEIHLHPRLQAHLADFLIRTSDADKRDDQRSDNANQWIIETHSEALMLRLQKRIREGELRPDNVSVLYVLPTPQGARILPLRLDEDGEFMDEWPGGFFEESFHELFGGREK